jgi:CO/xanthine dehydrogenase Mo-binding subunit
MPLNSTEKPYTTPQDREDELSRDPRWTPSFSSNVAASNGVYYYGHSTREAARALARYGLWPAAFAIWAQGPSAGKAAALRFEDATFAGGRVSVGGLEPLPLERVAAKAHEMGLITGVAVHTFNRNRGGWAQAEFDIPSAGRTKLPIDGLSVQYGDGAPADRKALMTSGGFHFIARSSVSYPGLRDVLGLTHQSSIATLVEIAVTPASGMNICRSTRTGRATARGISTATTCRAPRRWRCGTRPLRFCRRVRRPILQRASARWS